MTQLNPNIILGVQRAKTVNPLEMYQAKASIEQNELANRLGGLKVQEYERGVQESNAQREAVRGFGADTTANYNSLLRTGNLKAAQDYLEGNAKIGRERATGDKTKIETVQKVVGLMGSTAFALSQSPTLNIQEVAGAVEQLKAQLPQEYHAALDVSKLPQDPQGLRTALQGIYTKSIETEKLLADQTSLRNNDQTNATSRANNAANNAVQMRGQNLTDARSREANAAGGKAPPGYRFKQDGSLEAIPGGPADIKAGEAGAKREQMQQGSLAQADRIIAKVDQALEKVGMNSAGMGGSLMAKIPGTDATNLRTDLDTIKANLGFAELQAMRQASPTGGALGAIAVQELVALQSTVASLDQAQTPEQLKARLGEVRKHYSNWKEAVEQSGKPQAGGATGDFGKPAAPAAALPSGWKVQAR